MQADYAVQGTVTQENNTHIWIYGGAVQVFVTDYGMVGESETHLNNNPH